MRKSVDVTDDVTTVTGLSFPLMNFLHFFCYNFYCSIVSGGTVEKLI